MSIKSSMPSTLSPGLLAQKIEAVLRSGVLTNNGPVVQRLENELLPEALELSDDQDIALVSNGTVALEMCYYRTNIIIPSYTFCATALVFSSGVVFADVDQTGLIDTDSIDKIIANYGFKPENTTIVGVDLFAQNCGPRLEKYAEQGFNIIIDAAQSFGIHHKTKYPHLRTFSFHATKTIHCCEGGGIVGPKNYIEKVKKWRAFGDPEWYSYGTNAKMDEVRATILEHNLSNAWDVLHNNGHLIDYIYRPILPSKLFKTHAQRYALLKIDQPQLRKNILDALEQENVYLRTYFEPLHLQKRFNDYVPDFDLSTSESLNNAFIALPLGWDLKAEQAERIAWICVEQISKFQANNPA